MTRRRLVLGGAVLAGAAGVALTLATPGPSSPSGAVLPVVLEAGALLAGLWRARQWLGHDTDVYAPGDREDRTPSAVPGTEFDRRLDRVPAVQTSGRNSLQAAIRDGLRETALDVLTRFQGYERSEAEAALDSGTWTGDRYAAELFTSSDGTGDSVRESIAGSVTGRGPFHRRAARAASEVERLSRGEEQ